jgi:hypothetical protein
MKPIPTSAAERIAKEFGYDQVVIIARKVGDAPDPHGEHCTTYGIDKAHCAVAARIGDFLKFKVMGWVKDAPAPDPNREELISELAAELGTHGLFTPGERALVERVIDAGWRKQVGK